MIFESLSEKMLGSFKKLKGQHKISESNIEDAIKEIRLSLLEADVHFKVVKNFIDRVKAKAIGAEGSNPCSFARSTIFGIKSGLATTSRNVSVIARLSLPIRSGDRPLDPRWPSR